MRKRSKADGGLTAAALEYLATCRSFVKAERRNAGELLVPKKGGGFYKVFLGEEGTPDITGYVFGNHRMAVPFGIETKARRGKLRQAQIEWKEWANACGVPYCEARSISDVRDFVNYLKGIQ